MWRKEETGKLTGKRIYIVLSSNVGAIMKGIYSSELSIRFN